jgi:hypothetical protein
MNLVPTPADGDPPSPISANHWAASAEGDRDAKRHAALAADRTRIVEADVLLASIRRAAALSHSILFVQEGNDDVEDRPNAMPSSHRFCLFFICAGSR